MQVTPFSAAAQAASIAAQGNNSDKTNQNAPNAGTTASAVNAKVENSGSADADRDAQGQGDGLADRGERKRAVDERPDESTSPMPSGHLPGEEPGELDIIG